MNEFNFNSYGNSKQIISYCEVDKCPAVIKLREQLEAYKMEAEEGKEINAELKADREEALKQLEFVRTLNTVKEAENRKLSKTLTEIKEILLKTPTDSQEHCVNVKSVILQKISECEVDDERI